MRGISKNEWQVFNGLILPIVSDFATSDFFVSKALQMAISLHYLALHGKVSLGTHTTWL